MFLHRAQESAGGIVGCGKRQGGAGARAPAVPQSGPLHLPISGPLGLGVLGCPSSEASASGLNVCSDPSCEFVYNECLFFFFKILAYIAPGGQSNSC